MATDLTKGNISKALIKLALPIMGTSFIQMAYGLTDMLWIGRVGSDAVAAVGAAGFFVWLSMAFVMLVRIGADVGVSQSVGKGDQDGVRGYIVNTVFLGIGLGVLYGIVLMVFRSQLIGVFNIKNQEVVGMAKDYISILGIGTAFSFVNPVFTAIFNAHGDSKTPFKINVIGLVINMVLDPILILGIGPISGLGAKGAAIATIVGHFVVFIVFLVSLGRNLPIIRTIGRRVRLEGAKIKQILRVGAPVAVHSAFFTIIAMIVGRIIAGFGEEAFAVNKIGSQIESISWMTASGFSTAICAFVGQNYGAMKYDRVVEGYKNAMKIIGPIGIFATLALILFAKPIMTVFIPEEPLTIAIGVEYLRILGLSQLFMCIEITTAGAFNGLSKTKPPAIVGIIFNLLRIPAALILSRPEILGLNGIWWSVSMSSVFKGVVLTSLFVIFLKKRYNRNLVGM